MNTCSLCNVEFDLEREGGITGYMGICRMEVCVWCHSGLGDLYDKLRLPVTCPKCGWFESKEDEEAER